MVKRTPGRDKVRDIWAEHIGSHKLSPQDELAQLKELKDLNLYSWKVIHRMYIDTKVWRALRKQRVEIDGNKCVVCSSVWNLQVNHLCYPEMGDETMEDLETLCVKCHAKKTMRYDLEAGIKPRLHRMRVGKRQLFSILRTKGEIHESR